MSTLSDKYSRNFSKERKAIFNKRFKEDFDPAMSELSNILRILAEMRSGNKDGGRIGLKEGLGSFETNDPGEAMKEVINRIINKGVINDWLYFKSILFSKCIIYGNGNYNKYNYN